MEIKEIADKLEKGLSKADTIIECDDVSIADTDRIYISFIESIDAHGVKDADLVKCDCTIEEYVFDKAEEYVKWLLQTMYYVSAKLELDCEPINGGKELWVYGDIVID